MYLEMKPFEALQEWNRTLIAKVSQQMDLIERMSRLKRYISPKMADSILESNDPEILQKLSPRDHSYIYWTCVVLQPSRIALNPKRLWKLLRSYHTEMGKLTFKFGGTIEHFVADGLMVFFNAPIPCEDHTEKAMRLSLAMRDRVKELRTRWLHKWLRLGFRDRISGGICGRG